MAERRRLLDVASLEAYKGVVSAQPRTTPHDQPPRTQAVKRRRRAPSLSEQERRKANRAADNAYWKALKAGGRWQ